MATHISVQTADFDLAQEYARFAGDASIGAIVAFVGCVREMAGVPAGETPCMALEHYPGMTEKSLARIVAQAEKRWPLQGVTLIHRVGELALADQIVLVLTASAHRAAAYEANQYIMDYLKTEAPFWKRESGPHGAQWVDARDSDNEARERWESKYD